jgi:polyhydroxyalkanoate synthesis regulator phasin
MAAARAGTHWHVNPRRVCSVLLAAALTCAVNACAGPTTGAHDYRLKLANTAEALESSAQTVIMAGDLLDKGRAYQPYAANVISDAEDDATSVQETFDSRQPPDTASDQLRQQADNTIEDVVGAISDARIAARASELSDLTSALDQLRELLSDLQKLQGV